MTFRFDAQEARKPRPASANPANSANPASAQQVGKPQISRVSSISSEPPAKDEGYTLADLVEMDDLIRQLAEIEGWTSAELAEARDERRRMAPARVPEVLRQLRYWVKAGLAGWPDKPAKRAQIRLCQLIVIEGGKSAEDQAKEQ